MTWRPFNIQQKRLSFSSTVIATKKFSDLCSPTSFSFSNFADFSYFELGEIITMMRMNVVECNQRKKTFFQREKSSNCWLRLLMDKVFLRAFSAHFHFNSDEAFPFCFVALPMFIYLDAAVQTILKSADNVN